MYNNPLLIELENKFTGATIGYIRVPHVTVADDLTLMSNCTSEMQVMVQTSGTVANKARYVIHPTKSCILSYWEKYIQSCEHTYTMNGEEMSKVEQTKQGYPQWSEHIRKSKPGQKDGLLPDGSQTPQWKWFKTECMWKVWLTYVINILINAWNELPDNIVNAPSVNAFKNRLNNHWHGHPYKFEPACYQSGHPTREYSQNRQDAHFRS